MPGYSIGQFHQDIFPDIRRQITLRRFKADDAGEAAEYIQRLETPVLGIALHLSPTGVIAALAFASPNEVVWVSTQKLAPASDAGIGLGRLLRGTLTCLASFDMAQVALQIYKDLKMHVRGVDLSTLISISTDKPLSPETFATRRLGPSVRCDRIGRLWDGKEETDVCGRAFVMARLAEVCRSEMDAVSKVATVRLSDGELDCLANMVSERQKLQEQEPTVRQNDFNDVIANSEGATIHNSRFKSRARTGSKITLEMKTDDGSIIRARPVGVEGKQTHIRMSAGYRGNIKEITIHGREDPTCAEKAFYEFILLALMGQVSLHESDFIHQLWFPERALQPLSSDESMLVHVVDGALNESQSQAAHIMLSTSRPLVLVHGPPGTGKTTVISAAAKAWDARKAPAWIAAQSNVAVKNIAKALLKRGVKFKLIVSKEFHFEWHEHLYEEMDRVVIRSDDLGVDGVRLIGENTIILCTVSMLSNPALHDAGIYQRVPLSRLVIDEASQISISEYIHLFHRFRHDLTKVCFFGDPCQLPPYGQDSVPSMKSIYHLAHLRPLQYLLDTQYRMPTPLGEFISKEMYDRKLRSEHQVREHTCVRFIDVWKGDEERRGTSWVNTDEAQTGVHLVRDYYKLQDFAVITAYDAQRSMIEEILKREGLPWEKVYNVDSFQGNEADYILVSAVRTSGAGFLRSRERINVMLTRCKKGMVIISNRNFLEDGPGRATMIGRLASHWKGNHGESATWVDWRHVAEKRADMPGVRGTGERSSPFSGSTFSWSTTTPPPDSGNYAVFSSKTPITPTTPAPSEIFRMKIPAITPAIDLSASSFVQRAQGKWASFPGTPTNPSASPFASQAHEKWRSREESQDSVPKGSTSDQSTIYSVRRAPETPSPGDFPVLGASKAPSSEPLGAWRRTPTVAPTSQGWRAQSKSRARVLRIVSSSTPPTPRAT